MRTCDSLRNCLVSIRGLRMTSTAPASSASSSVSEPVSSSVEHRTVGMGRWAMILRRKVMPSMRGISTSRTMTSGTSSLMRCAAMNGSPAVAMTSMSGAASMIEHSVWRTEAELSTTRTRIFAVRGVHAVLSSRATKDGRSHLPHRAQLGAGERFRMPEDQEAAFAQVIAEALQHGVLRRLGEIDENVTAEDDVEVAVDAIASGP